MANYVSTSTSSGNRFTNQYANISMKELAQQVEAYFMERKYKKEQDPSGSVRYIYGSRVMRLLFGAFCKYFKFTVAMRQIDENTIEMTVTKDTSGMSGGAIGVGQVDSEFTKIKLALNAL